MFILPQDADLRMYLEKNSKLPGPAANLNLLKQFIENASEEQVSQALSAWDKDPDVNAPVTFTVMCGVAASGKADIFRRAANSSNWRIRESAVLGLQHSGEKNIDEVFAIFTSWNNVSTLEKRCIAATLCEPKFLTNPATADKTLDILSEYMDDIEIEKNIKSEEYKALKKSLGYCLSVAVVALPERGKEMFERWMRSPSLEIRWILSENLKHQRLRSLDSAWVDAQIEFLSDVE